jgi:predicted O-methyltransferase YrrM
MKRKSLKSLPLNTAISFENFSLGVKHLNPTPDSYLQYSLHGIGRWLQQDVDELRRERIYSLGRITGLRESKGIFTTPNFERGLVLDRLCEIFRPASVLELGTGRGLGALTAATAGDVYGYETAVTTIDSIPISKQQRYAIEEHGVRRVDQLSVEEVWKKHVSPEVRRRVTFLTGTTTKILPKLNGSGRRFDLVFIDAGHDLFDVIHDLAYSTALLSDDGVILMDDFAPREAFGLGTVLAFTHAKRLFRDAFVFDSDGVVYGVPDPMQPPRGMVLLNQPSGRFTLRRSRLWLWRVIDNVLRAAVHKATFPVRVD